MNCYLSVRWSEKTVNNPPTGGMVTDKKNGTVRSTPRDFERLYWSGR